ncbi:unnamed protein product [Pseudo-nitzschia multistriata]|uniref:Uncharacterized protein n=1 Tax=Pseudo-nitzschia multistriata TaxID=183589 RepID=A0A448Z8Q0_9STRA|nr:unnamed protein product [Pseudo-nitzschia multistriata]
MVEPQQQQQEQEQEQEQSPPHRVQTTIEDDWNNIVALSEYDAAVAAIESTFDRFRSGNQGERDAEHGDEHGDGDGGAPPLDRDVIAEIYEAARASLLANVARVVRPVHDNDYSDYVDRYHFVLDDSDDDDNDNDDNNDDNSEEEDSDGGESEEEEQEIDEEELVDAKAWENARELRTRVRTMAARVQSVRERVLKHTEEGVSSAVSGNLIDPQVRVVFDGEPEGDGDKDNDKDKNDLTSPCASEDKENLVDNNDGTRGSIRQRRNKPNACPLRNSLEELSELLKDPKWASLPNRIQSLQETIETVQRETSEDRVMSQTETAITSRYKNTIDASERRRVFGEDSGEDGDSLLAGSASMDPMDRLALFGQIFS